MQVRSSQHGRAASRCGRRMWTAPGCSGDRLAAASPASRCFSNASRSVAASRRGHRDAGDQPQVVERAVPMSEPGRKRQCFFRDFDARRYLPAPYRHARGGAGSPRRPQPVWPKSRRRGAGHPEFRRAGTLPRVSASLRSRRNASHAAGPLAPYHCRALASESPCMGAPIVRSSERRAVVRDGRSRSSSLCSTVPGRHEGHVGSKPRRRGCVRDRRQVPTGSPRAAANR